MGWVQKKEENHKSLSTKLNTATKVSKHREREREVLTARIMEQECDLCGSLYVHDTEEETFSFLCSH